MYIPSAFRVEDPAAVRALVEEFSFATLVTSGETGLVASHLPFLYRESPGGPGFLTGHMARANTQWKDFREAQEVLVIFQGPHAYISPRWYESSPSVPTWNYAAVHAYGYPRLLESYEEVSGLLKATVDRYEAGSEAPWKMDLPEEYQRRLVGQIVAFEIRLTRLEGKSKFSQNRNEQDRNGVIEHLSRSDDPLARDVAERMRKAAPQK